MRRAYPWLTVISFLGCLVLGYFVLQQKTEILQVNLRRSDADRAIREQTMAAQHQLAAAKAAQAQAAKQAMAAKAGGAAAAGRPAEADREANMKVIHISDIVKEHPEFATLMAEQRRRNILGQYGPLLASLNLPADQVAKLKDLLVERSQAEEDAQQAAKAAGLTQGTPAWRDAIKQAQTAVEDEMAAVTGTDGRQFAAQLQNEVSAQNQIRITYSLDFNDAGVGLSSDQSQGLTQAIANASYVGKSTADRPANYNEVDSDTMLSPHDERILKSAAATLNASQVEILKTDLMQVHQRDAIMKQYAAGANGQPVSIVP